MIKKIAIVGGIISFGLVLAACKSYQTQQTTTKVPTATAGSTTVDETNAVVITYSDAGFSPATANAKVGQKVIFKNTSSAAIQVNSAPHPTHTLYPMLNIGTIAAGGMQAVTFDKAGTYKYHNHLNSSQSGTIVVE